MGGFFISGSRVFKRFLSAGERDAGCRPERCGNPVSTGILDAGCWKKWVKNQATNNISASSINHSVHNSIKLSFVLVLEFFIFSAETLNAAGCVDKLLFAGEKGMAF